MIELGGNLTVKFERESVVIELLKNANMQWHEQNEQNTEIEYNTGDTFLFYENCQFIRTPRKSATFFHIKSYMKRKWHQSTILEPSTRLKLWRWDSISFLEPILMSFTQPTKMSFGSDLCTMAKIPASWIVNDEQSVENSPYENFNTDTLMTDAIQSYKQGKIFSIDENTKIQLMIPCSILFMQGGYIKLGNDPTVKSTQITGGLIYDFEANALISFEHDTMLKF